MSDTPISFSQSAPDASSLPIVALVPAADIIAVFASAPAVPPVGPLSLQVTEWKPAEANDGPFREIRVVLDAALEPIEVDRVVDALDYALKETVWARPLDAPTAVIVSPEAGETVLEFPFSSGWVGRAMPDYDIAFNVADIRILHGSNVRYQVASVKPPPARVRPRRFSDAASNRGKGGRFGLLTGIHIASPLAHTSLFVFDELPRTTHTPPHEIAE